MPQIVMIVDTMPESIMIRVRFSVLGRSDGTIAITGSASGDTLKHIGVFAGCEYVSSTTGEKVFSNTWPGSGADTNFDIVGFVYDNRKPNLR